MKKTAKILIVVGALALALGFGLVKGGEIRPLVDPPYTLVNLK